MSKPSNLLIYYGYPNSFNSAANQWNNELVAQEMACYDLIVLGSGVQDPTHGDYNNSKVIIPRILEVNDRVMVFGYVDVAQTFESFKIDVGQWIALGVNGVFLDQAGYDFGTAATNGREALNEKVDFLHRYGLVVFANAWNPSHVLDETNDVSYPNSTWNPNLDPSSLGEDDWYLMENFGVTNGSYESASQWKSRGDKIKEIVAEKPIKLASVSVISDTDNNGQDKFYFSFISSLIFLMDAHGSSDTSYGASSAKAKMWARPNMCGIEAGVDTGVHNNGNKYFRYMNQAKLEVDFTSGSESYQILNI